MFSVLKLALVTSHVILRVSPFKRGYQINRFQTAATFIPLNSIHGDGENTLDLNSIVNIEVPDQTYELEKSLKDTKLTTGTTLSIQELVVESERVTNQMNDNMEALHIKLLSITDLEEVSVLIPKIFQSSRHNWGPALGLPDSGFSEYMKTYLPEPMLIEELGCFGVRFEGNSKLVGALVLENGPPLVKKEEEKGENKEKEEEDPKVDPALLEAYQAITGILAESEELFRSEYLRRLDQGVIGYKMDSKLAYVGNEISIRLLNYTLSLLSLLSTVV
jgi:hypothetical protein